jgi:two-component system phosphate regulon response regulator PhoB
MPKKILLVDSEAEVGKLLGFQLRELGFHVISAHDGASGLGLARDRSPSLIVLDLDLPKISGFDVCRQLQADNSTRHIPFIVLTALATEKHRILGFELGADDYVTKPFSVREVILRIRKSLERHADQPVPSRKHKMSFGDLVLDPIRHEVTIQNKKIHLTPIEFRLLEALMQRPGRAFGRGTFLEVVWAQHSNTDTRTVDSHIRRLRGKLGPAGSAIETIVGYGYRLNENVSSPLQAEMRQLKLDYIDYPLERIENGKPRYSNSRKSQAELLAPK